MKAIELRGFFSPEHELEPRTEINSAAILCRIFFVNNFTIVDLRTLSQLFLFPTTILILIFLSYGQLNKNTYFVR